MANSRYYYKNVVNPLTGQSVTITGSTQAVLANKVQSQAIRWNKDLNKVKAQQLTDQAQAEIVSYRSLLAATLAYDDKIDWEKLYNKKTFKEPPQWEEFAPHFSKLSGFLPGMKAKQQVAEQEAQQAHKQALKAYEKEKEVFLAEQAEFNKKVDALKTAYEKKVPVAFIKCSMANSMTKWVENMDAANGKFPNKVS